MTLDEGIQHCQEKVQELGQCNCAEEHKQLLYWLLELKAFREEMMPITAADIPQALVGVDLSS